MQRTVAFAGNHRHPFRQAVRQARVLERKRRDDSDIRLFALSFAAFFVCFYTFFL